MSDVMTVGDSPGLRWRLRRTIESVGAVRRYVAREGAGDPAQGPRSAGFPCVGTIRAFSEDGWPVGRYLFRRGVRG